MDVIDHPRPIGDLASKLAAESLDHLSVDELAKRITLLEAEIVRTAAHRDGARRHRAAADALFGKPDLGKHDLGKPASGSGSGA